MSAPSTHEITALLQAWNGGDHQALEKLTPLVYEELYRAANDASPMGSRTKPYKPRRSSMNCT